MIKSKFLEIGGLWNKSCIVVAVFLSFSLCGCTALISKEERIYRKNTLARNLTDSIASPRGFVYEEIDTPLFRIAAWVKRNGCPDHIKIYIEGDGQSFNAYGHPTENPTPEGLFLRSLAFGDKTDNAVYLARPCQYIMSAACSQKYWTTGRFSVEIIDSMSNAAMRLARQENCTQAEITLVGFSGGAQIAGLMAALDSNLNVRKIITVSGNLDHPAWTRMHKVQPLKDSLDLNNWKNIFLEIDSINYAGEKDKIVPPSLIKAFAGAEKTIIVPGATHGYYPPEILYSIQEEK